MTTATGSVCRSCNTPIEWRDTDQGRRPFNPDGSRHQDSTPYRKPANGNGASSPARDRAIARMSALRSAAIFAGHRANVDESVKSSDVLRIAEAWLAWLEAPGRE